MPTVLKHLFFATGETQSMIQCSQVYTNRYSGSALTYIRRTAVGNAVDMACSVLIDLSFCVAKEGIYKEEPSVFESRHEFFNSEPYIFGPCEKLS